jgi:hypothetical protein
MNIKDTEYKTITILPTTPTCYITGKEALNLEPPEGTSGDWHFSSVFFDVSDSTRVVSRAGDGETVNTNHIYGQYGIYECSSVLRKYGLSFNGEKAYAANHFRAILDMLYKSLKKHGEIVALKGATEDWFDSDEQKRLLLDKAEEMIPHLSEREQLELRNWIEIERLPEYKS